MNIKCLVKGHDYKYVSTSNIHYAYCDRCLKSVYVKS